MDPAVVCPIGLARIVELLVSAVQPSEAEGREIASLVTAHTRALASLNPGVDPFGVTRAHLTRCIRLLARLGVGVGVASLPFEILVEIFGQTVRMTGDPWPLSHVDHRWREVALATAALWTTIDIDASSDNRKLRPTGFPLEKLHTVLDRSRAALLTIRFCTLKVGEPHCPPSSGSNELLTALVGHSPRWRSVFLRCGHASYPVLSRLRDRIPMLESLGMHCVHRDPPFHGFEIAPRLRSLDFQMISQNPADSLVVPWHQITQYSAKLPLLEDHMEALVRLTNVEECSLLHLNSVVNDHHGTVSLPRLRRLYVMRGDMLQFNAPGLVELVLEQFDVYPRPDMFGNLLGLVQLSKCGLTKLCLISTLTDNAEWPAVIAVLRAQPSLCELCIQYRGHHLIHRVRLEPLVTALLPTPSEPLVPRLERLTIGGYECQNTAQLVDMLVARRRAAPTTCSRLLSFSYFHTYRVFPFSLVDDLRLRALRSGGLSVLDAVGREGHAAMVNVPFYHADMSDWQYWAPSTLAV